MKEEMQWKPQPNLQGQVRRQIISRGSADLHTPWSPLDTTSYSFHKSANRDNGFNPQIPLQALLIKKLCCLGYCKGVLGL